MKKFEYLKRKLKTEDELNKLGAEGWELVAVITHFRGVMMGDIPYMYFFKRELESK